MTPQAQHKPAPPAEDPAPAERPWLALAAGLLLALLPGGMKLHKVIVISQGRVPVLDALWVLAPDLAIALGSCLLLLIWLGRRSRQGASNALPRILVGLGLMPVLGLSALEHQGWARTASLVDFPILLYTYQHLDELGVVVASETTVGGVALLLGSVLLAWLPAALDAAALRWGRGVSAVRMRRVRQRLALGAAASLLLCPLDPTLPELEPIDQSASLGLLLGALRSAERAQARDSAISTPSAEAAAHRLQQSLARAQPSLVPEATALVTGRGEPRPGTERGEPRPLRPRNVLLFVLESVRYDATSLYAHRLGNTPRLEQLAQHGAVVDRAYVDMPHTSKALVSILCGNAPRMSVEIGEAQPGGIPDACLAHLLDQVGFRTAFFQAARGTFENRGQLVQNFGFADFFARESYDQTGFEETNYLSVEDKVMVKPLLSWVAKQRDRPFFATLLTCISHHSYGLPNRFRARQYPHRAALQGGRMPLPWSEYNRYLNTIRYSDELIGDVLDGLARQGKLDDTLVVVVGDHGQGFLEHGQRAHNTVIWEEGLHVPLLFANARSFAEPQHVAGPRRQVDIAPTILGLLGVQLGTDIFEGRNLLSEPAHERIHSSCWYDERCMAETTETRRVIHHFAQRGPELYDLAADPMERTNLVARGNAAQKAAVRAEVDAAVARMLEARSAIEQRYQAQAQPQSSFVSMTAPSPANRVPVRLGTQLELLGYDAKSHRVKPGEFWEAVIHFKCLEPSAEGWRLFHQVRAVDGRDFQVDYDPAGGQLRLNECKPGSYVADHVRIWIPDDSAPGPLAVFWGSVRLQQRGDVSRDNRRLARRPVVALERGVPIHDQSVRLARVEVEPVFREALQTLLQRSVLHSAPKVDKPLDVRIGGGLTLLEARFDPVTIKPFGATTLTTLWRVDAAVKGPWQFYVNLESDHPRFQRFGLERPHTPVDGMHPFANWQPGTWVRDVYVMPVPWSMPPGPAKVWASLRYEKRKMPVTAPGNALVERDRVLLGTVEIGR